MLKARVVLALSCPRHTRYNPIAGEDAIKGGCTWCHRLLKIQRQIDALGLEARQYRAEATEFSMDRSPA